MADPAQLDLSLGSRHFCSVALIIPASTLTTSHDCPILSSSAVSLGTFFPAVSIIRLFDCSSF